VRQAFWQGTTLSGTAPVLVNLIRPLAERFGVVLSQKAAAEIIPIIGKEFYA
jgi:hypothetical protein